MLDRCNFHVTDRKLRSHPINRTKLSEIVLQASPGPVFSDYMQIFSGRCFLYCLSPCLACRICPHQVSAESTEARLQRSGRGLMLPFSQLKASGYVSNFTQQGSKNMCVGGRVTSQLPDWIIV